MRQMSLIFVLSWVAACAASTGEPNEHLTREEIYDRAIGTPEQGEMPDGTIRYCEREEHSDDGQTRIDLFEQLKTAVLIQKCGDQVHFQSVEVIHHHSKTNERRTASVFGIVPREQTIGKWRCATIDPRRAQVRCPPSSGESTPLPPPDELETDDK